MAGRATFGSIDEYVAAFPPDVRAIFERIRATIREAVPQAVETICYNMPAFALEGDLVYFAAFKKHIGVYPPVRGDAKLDRELARYRGEKGNLKFPLEEPIPYEVVRRVVRFRVREQREAVRSARRKK